MHNISSKPFRRIDTSSNTTIGLKTVWYEISSKQNLSILELAHICYFSFFYVFFSLFPQIFRRSACYPPY